MKSVLLTGSTGFLGSVIKNIYELNGYHIDTIGRSAGNNIRIDLASQIPELFYEYNQIIHCAAKVHSIPKTQGEIEQYFKVNLNATINLCNAINRLPFKPKQFVFISSVAVYGLNYGELIDENFPLNGKTPYALSKIEAERFLLNWGDENGIKVLILRLPLIVGNNPPGNLGKLIAGICKGTYFSIAGGLAKKSVVMVEDVANLILNNPISAGVYNLTDGNHPSFAEIEALIAKQLGKAKPRNIPKWFAILIGKVGDLFEHSSVNTQTILKITTNLTFSNEKARLELNWKPSDVLSTWKITM
jgi:nucleoside-diphosphate-sugar epimerase